MEEEVSESEKQYEEYKKEEEEEREKKIDPQKEEKIKKIFWDLVKKYHPDRAPTEEKKKEYHEIMAKINEAYRKKDIDTLLYWAKKKEEEIGRAHV